MQHNSPIGKCGNKLDVIKLTLHKNVDTLAFFFLLFDGLEVADDEVRAPAPDDVTATPLAGVPDGKEGAAEVGVVGVLGGVGVELLLVDRDGVAMKGRLIFAALFSRSRGMTAESSSLLSMSFFTRRAMSTNW